MPDLPVQLSIILSAFAGLFTQPTWLHAQCLAIGALLCQGPRRVTSILRVMGLAKVKRFEKYHRVLNRAPWNNLKAAQILLGLLVLLLPAHYPLLLPIDDTLERRQGKHIKAKGVYRDACRSTDQQVVTLLGFEVGLFDADSAAPLEQSALGFTGDDATRSIPRSQYQAWPCA